MIALPAGDDVAPLRLALLDEILPRHFQRRFDRFRPAADEIDMTNTPGRIGGQTVGQLLRHLGGEETGMGVGDLVELCMQRGQHVRMAMAEAGNRRAARGIDIGAPRIVENVDSLAADGDGQF